MLITCPECSRNVSDKANICPGCGYPIQPKEEKATKPAKKIYKRKRMRLPNGFGRITEIKNKNLRNPFRVMITVGVDDTGRPIGKLLQPKAYFKTYNEAYQALMEYNKDPFSLENDMTVSELYELWVPEYAKGVSKSRVASIKAAWNYCSPLKNTKLHEVKPMDIKNIIENGVRYDGKGKEIKITQSNSIQVKVLFSMMFDFAIERGLLDKNSARVVKNKKEISNSKNKNEMSHTAYTEEEINILLNNLDDPICSFIVIQCYSGWRPSELLNIPIESIDIDNWIFTGGMKTEYGIDRSVPIHSKIQKVIEKLYNSSKKDGDKYLFVNKSGESLPYRTFSERYYKTLNRLNINLEHKPHDGRVTFVTKAKNANLDEYAIKRIVGHSIIDLTERVYTERSIEWLRDQIEMIK